MEDVDEGMTVMIEFRAKLVQNGNKGHEGQSKSGLLMSSGSLLLLPSSPCFSPSLTFSLLPLSLLFLLYFFPFENKM